MTQLTPELEGARSLLTDGLRLRTGDGVLFLCQDSLSDLSGWVQQAAETLGLHLSIRQFESSEFEDGRYPRAFKARRLATERPKPAGIALAIEWSEETTEARLRMLRELSNARQAWRIASMPGLDSSTLALCRSDFTVIRGRSSMLFAALGRSVVATLTTPGPAGQQDSLRLPIPTCPILSTGEIDLDSWGNFPSGEVFLLPTPMKADGWVTLRGSYPRRSLADDEWVRFEVSRGRLRAPSVSASSADLAQDFLSLFFGTKGRAKGLNTNAIAELGIGVNPAITHLTGKPLFDEKKLGTAHLGVGRNDQFGGPLESSCHHDLTIERCSLFLTTRLGDSVSVLENGEYVLDNSSALPRIEPSNADNDNMEYRYSTAAEVAVEFSHNGSNELASKLAIKYAPPRGSPVTFTIAEGYPAQLANGILQCFRPRKAQWDSKMLADRLGANEQTVRAVLRGLAEHGLLKR